MRNLTLINRDYLFVGEDYNIFTDKTERKIPKDPRVLEEVFLAYCRVLRAKRAANTTRLSRQLDEIHEDLHKRIAAIEPTRSTDNDSQ